MTISSIQSQPQPEAANVALENLAGNQHLTEQQKIAETSRQFEAIMLRQILSESQKPVITSEFTDNSTAAGIYQDYVTNTLADSMSKAGTLGLAKIFEQQLSHHVPKAGAETTKAAALSAFQKSVTNPGPVTPGPKKTPPFQSPHP